MQKITTTSVALAVALLATPLISYAQAPQDIGHKQAEDFAAWLASDGQYAKAAGLYAQAYEEKARRAYAYQAAELYFFVKDYAKAEEFYAIAAESSDFPDANLKVARARKRMTNFEGARDAFTAYAKTYVREDSAAVRATVDTEIAGLDLAIAELERVDPTVFVDRLSGTVNGMKNEITPMAMADGKLAFVSDFDGTMRAYTTAPVKGGGWEQMRPAAAMPVIEEGHIGGASLVTPDRFYFGLCEQRQNMSQPAAACQINVVKQQGGKWGKPTALPGNINPEGSTSAQPFVFIEGDKEVMIYASDRAGGAGGMDIWRSERSISGKVDAFGTPVNLGPSVNGPGNEVTPFFDTETRVLSFSSDGGATIGGYDVFQATANAELTEFTEAVNPGTPINSSGDDYYYRDVPGTSRAYLASNRSENMMQTRMSNDDLYAVTYDNPNVTVEVAILDARSGEPVSDPTLTVRLNPDGRMLKPLTVRRSLDGYYELTLPVDREIVFEVERPYFDAASLNVRIPASGADGHDMNPIRIERTALAEDDIRVVERAPGRKRNAPDAAPVMTASGEEDEGEN